MRPILSLTLLLAVSAFGFEVPDMAPQTQTLEPRVGKPGTIIKIKGLSLDRNHVDEVYLTDHRFDMKVKILAQSERELTIRVPPFVKPGRLQLLILTAGNRPVYLEQPLYVQIENPDEEASPVEPPPVQISKKAPPKPAQVEVASVGATIPLPTEKAPAATAPAAIPTPPPPTATATALPVTVKDPPPAVIQPKVEAKKQEPKNVEPPKVEPKLDAKLEPPPSTQPQIPQTVQAQPQPQAQQAPPPVPQPAVTAPPATIMKQAAPSAAASASFVPPQLLRRSRVAYPVTAMSKRIEGEVELLAVVKADGHIKSVKIVRGNPFLTNAAVSGLTEWIYEPARQDGVAVEAEVSVLMHFTLPK